MTLNRYRIEDRNTGRTIDLTCATSDQARRKAWRHFGYQHVPFTAVNMTTLIVTCLGPVVAITSAIGV